MKLRNKKTGEIVDLNEGMISDSYDGEKIEIRSVAKRDNEVYVYSSLAELNEEWEDAPEEPKVGYIIDPMEEDCVSADDSGYEEPDVGRAKELGIWFETKEEAELAVRKLKALKRLKDTYHISFNLDFVKNTISFTYRIDGTLHSVVDDERIVFEDMKTIFGGEE